VTLLELLTAAGEPLAGVSVSVDPSGGVIWDRVGRPFATSSVDGLTAEFRLDPPVAAAAVRTPDTERSRRGEDWVRFRPDVPDKHALDRAEAWFGSAWRRAEHP
jgi:hypothetical protein